MKSLLPSLLLLIPLASATDDTENHSKSGARDSNANQNFQ